MKQKLFLVNMTGPKIVRKSEIRNEIGQILKSQQLSKDQKPFLTKYDSRSETCPIYFWSNRFHNHCILCRIWRWFQICTQKRNRKNIEVTAALQRSGNLSSVAEQAEEDIVFAWYHQITCIQALRVIFSYGFSVLIYTFCIEIRFFTKLNVYLGQSHIKNVKMGTAFFSNNNNSFSINLK